MQTLPPAEYDSAGPPSQRRFALRGGPYAPLLSSAVFG